MAKAIGNKTHESVFKHTSQGGRNPKTSAMTKTEKRSYKRYRGQGK